MGSDCAFWKFWISESEKSKIIATLFIVKQKKFVGMILNHTLKTQH